MGAFASVIGAVLSAVMKPSPPSPPAPVAPPPPPSVPEEDKGTEPEGAADLEAARQRALKRRRAQQTTGLSLLEEETPNGDQGGKKLTGG